MNYLYKEDFIDLIRNKQYNQYIVLLEKTVNSIGYKEKVEVFIQDKDTQQLYKVNYTTFDDIFVLINDAHIDYLITVKLRQCFCITL